MKFIIVMSIIYRYLFISLLSKLVYDQQRNTCSDYGKGYNTHDLCGTQAIS